MADFRTQQVSRLLGQGGVPPQTIPTQGAEILRRQQLRGLLGQEFQPDPVGVEEELFRSQEENIPPLLAPEEGLRENLESFLFNSSEDVETREEAHRRLSKFFPQEYPGMNAVSLRRSITSGPISKITEEKVPPPSNEEFQERQRAEEVLFSSGGSASDKARASRFLGVRFKKDYPELDTPIKRRKFLLAEEKTRLSEEKTRTKEEKDRPTILSPSQHEEVELLETRGLLNSAISAKQRAQIYRRLVKLNPDRYPAPRSELDLMNSITTGQIAKATESAEANLSPGEQEERADAARTHMRGFHTRENIAETMRLGELQRFIGRQKAIMQGEGRTVPGEVTQPTPAGPTFPTAEAPDIIDFGEQDVQRQLREAQEFPATGQERTSILKQAGGHQLSPEEEGDIQRVRAKRRFRSPGGEISQPALPSGVSEEDMLYTMQQENMTREQVLQALQGR